MGPLSGGLVYDEANIYIINVIFESNGTELARRTAVIT